MYAVHTIQTKKNQYLPYFIINLFIRCRLIENVARVDHAQPQCMYKVSELVRRPHVAFIHTGVGAFSLYIETYSFFPSFSLTLPLLCTYIALLHQHNKLQAKIIFVDYRCNHPHSTCCFFSRSKCVFFCFIGSPSDQKEKDSLS